MFIEGFAIWHKQLVSNDGEIIGSDILEVKIPVCEHQTRTNASSSIGNYTVDGATLALRTNKSLAKDIQQDDEIVYKNKTYSVDQVQEVRSAAGFKAREYVIWMH